MGLGGGALPEREVDSAGGSAPGRSRVGHDRFDPVVSQRLLPPNTKRVSGGERQPRRGSPSGEASNQELRGVSERQRDDWNAGFQRAATLVLVLVEAESSSVVVPVDDADVGDHFHAGELGDPACEFSEICGKGGAARWS